MADWRFPHVRDLLNYLRGILEQSLPEDLRPTVEGLRSIHRTWSIIRATLIDAGEMEIQKKSKEWLQQLNELGYKLEDFLDSCEYELLRIEIEEVPNDGETTMEVHTISISNLLHNYDFQDKILRMDRTIQAQIDEIRGLRDELKWEETHDMKEDDEKSQETMSVQVQTDFFGRKDDVAEIIRLLHCNNIDPSSKTRVKDVYVIAVVGMGGLGKTALVQKVYDATVDFDIKGWVSVSHDYDSVRLTKKALESLSTGTPDLSNLDALQQKLKLELQGKKFLLVLDDIWDASYGFWENFLTPFGVGEVGSKVLITTRDKSVAESMSFTKPHMLGQLSDEDSWSLFKQCALLGDVVHDEFEKMGKEAVKKCNCLPLAVKVVGGLLRQYKDDPGRWREVLDSEIWKIDGGDEHILGPLRVSYFYLPHNLKPCFTFCAIFPKDQEIDRGNLIRLWMANDLIQPAARKQPEDIGMEYVDELLSRSLFQLSWRNGQQQKTVHMHDLIRDLSQHISGDECKTLMVDEDTETELPLAIGARHLSLWSSRRSYPNHLISPKVEGLRALLVDGNIDIRTYDGLPRLRVLCLRSVYKELEVLSDSISNLKHLRYLDLGGKGLKSLQDSVFKLYNLQTLDLSENCGIMQLSDEIGNLKQLRRLNLEGTCVKTLPHSICRLQQLRILDLPECIQELPRGIGMLSNLQSLNKFPLARDHAMLGELKNMVHLGGNLKIAGIGNNVVCEDEVEAAELMNKKRLRTLHLCWHPERRDQQLHPSVEEDAVLEKLKPHSNIEEINVSAFLGSVFPKWLGDPLLDKLRKVRLESCRRCTALTPLERLPCLEVLEVQNMDSLLQVYPERYEIESRFPSIRRMVMSGCPNLNSLPTLSLLEYLYLERCCSLKSVPLHDFSSLKKLEIKSCHNLESVDFEENEQHPHHILENLEIRFCPRLGSLPTLKHLAFLFLDKCNSLKSICLNNFSSLRSLHVKLCEYLESIDFERSEQHPSHCLQNLRLVFCTGFVSFPTALTKLDYLSVVQSIFLKSIALCNNSSLLFLSVKNCRDLLSIDSEEQGRHPFYCIEDLRIVGCGKLNFLPTLKSIKYLHMEDCASLESISICNVSSIQKLTIENCKNLVSVDFKEQAQHHPHCQQHVTLKSCPTLVSVPTLPWLASLDVEACDSLTSIPLPKHSSLEILCIDTCPSACFDPTVTQLPTTLKRLQIVRCPLLEKWCQQRAIAPTSSEPQDNAHQKKKKCMLGARDLGTAWTDHPEHWEWIYDPHSRFGRVPKLSWVTWLESTGSIFTTSLSPRTSYVACYVFKFSSSIRGFDSCTQVVSISIGGFTKRRNVCLRSRRDVKLRDDGWLEVVMGEFFVEEDAGGQEVVAKLLEEEGFKSGLIVEGIDFRPKLQSSELTCGQAFQSSVGSTSSSMGQSERKKSMLGATDLGTAWIHNRDYWEWIYDPQSRFGLVPKLIRVTWLESSGYISTGRLSPGTSYVACFVFKLSSTARGFASPTQQVSVSIGDITTTRNVCLQSGRDVKVREDGWTEVVMGEFFVDEGEGDKDVVAKLFDGKGWKKGLIVEGIEFRPK